MKTIAAGDGSAARVARSNAELAAARSVGGAGSEVFKSAEQSKAAAEMAAAKEAAGDLMKTLDNRIKAEQDKTKSLVSADADAVKRRVMTQSEATAQIIARYQEEKAAVEAIYAQEIALAESAGQRKREPVSREAAYSRQIALQVQAEQQKAAEATQRSWETAATQINSTFDSQISGLLRGTTSWEQASKNVLASLTESSLKYFLNQELLYAENLAKHVAMNMGLIASDATTQAAATGAHAAGAAAQWPSTTLRLWRTRRGPQRARMRRWRASHLSGLCRALRRRRWPTAARWRSILTTSARGACLMTNSRSSITTNSSCQLRKPARSATCCRAAGEAVEATMAAEAAAAGRSAFPRKLTST